MSELSEQILALLRRRNYQPLKPRALARKVGVATPQYTEFKRAIRTLLRDGRIEIGKNHTIRPTPPHGTVTGTYRRASTGILPTLGFPSERLVIRRKLIAARRF